MNDFLLEPQKFSSDYDLITHSEFTMGEENSILRLSSNSSLQVEQSPTKSGITTSVKIDDYNTESSHVEFEPFLHQASLLFEISKKVVFMRDVRGRILSIKNENELIEDWQKWKLEHLQDFAASPKEQEIFTRNYEKGLDNIVSAFQQNLQYLLINPDIYHFTRLKTEEYSRATQKRFFSSRFVPEMIVEYKFHAHEIMENKKEGLVKIKLISEINNKQRLESLFLNSFYAESIPGYSISDYSFYISIEYLLESRSGKIRKGLLQMNEKIHNYLQYKIIMDIFVREPEEPFFSEEEQSSDIINKWIINREE